MERRQDEDQTQLTPKPRLIGLALHVSRKETDREGVGCREWLTLSGIGVAKGCSGLPNPRL